MLTMLFDPRIPDSLSNPGTKTPLSVSPPPPPIAPYTNAKQLFPPPPLPPVLLAHVWFPPSDPPPSPPPPYNRKGKRGGGKTLSRAILTPARIGDRSSEKSLFLKSVWQIIMFCVAVLTLFSAKILQKVLSLHPFSEICNVI